MRRDLISLLAIMFFSSVVAAATNVFGHKMDWIRKPLDTPPTTQETSRPDDPSPVATTQRRTNTIDSDAVIEHLVNGSACFIDARDPSEYAAGHLHGSVNLPSSTVIQDIDKLLSVVSPNDPVIIYCGGRSCEASHSVSDALRRYFEFKNVLIYEKGWEEIESSDRFSNWIVTGDEP